MKLRIITSATLLSLIPLSVTLATIAFLPNPAVAQVLGQSPSDCVREVMYDTFGNVKRGMTAEAAAFACRNARANSSASSCMQQTMYDDFGNIKRGMTAEAAAFACRSARANNSVSGCMQQTMYDDFGNIKRGMTPEAAAFACADYQGYPGKVIIIQR